MLTDGKSLFAVEVESGQMHLDTNVGKYWFLASQYQAYSAICLIQIFTPLFSSYEWRMRLGRFYARQMKESGLPLEYVVLDERRSDSVTGSFSRARQIIEEHAKVLFG